MRTSYRPYFSGYLALEGARCFLRENNAFTPPHLWVDWCASAAYRDLAIRYPKPEDARRLWLTLVDAVYDHNSVVLSTRDPLAPRPTAAGFFPFITNGVGPGAPPEDSDGDDSGQASGDDSDASSVHLIDLSGNFARMLWAAQGLTPRGRH